MEGNSTVLSKGPGDKKHGGCSACSTDEHPDDRLPGPPLAPAPAPAPVPGPKACGNERGLLTTDLDNLRCQHLHLVRQHAPLDGLKQGGSRPSSLWWGWEGGYLRGGRSGLEGLNRLSVAWMKGRQECGGGGHISATQARRRPPHLKHWEDALEQYRGLGSRQQQAEVDSHEGRCCCCGGGSGGRHSGRPPSGECSGDVA